MLEAMKAAFDRINAVLAARFVGLESVIEQLLIALLAEEHCLLEGPPGTARSVLTASLARVLGLPFDRVRCTPDLSPADLVGLGALFENVVLVDDFTRLAPRADSLVQQALQEDHVDWGGRRYELPSPYLIVATLYPEDEEADLAREHHDDRFMLKIALSYPSYDDEYQMACRMSAPPPEPLEQLVTAEEISRFREIARQTEMPPYLVHYILRLVRATRVHEGETPDFTYEWLDCGAGPRAGHSLTLAAKIRAALHGRGAATQEDVRSTIHPVLRHRLILNRNARSTGITIDRVIQRLLYETPPRVEGDDRAPSESEDG